MISVTWSCKPSFPCIFLNFAGRCFSSVMLHAPPSSESISQDYQSPWIELGIHSATTKLIDRSRCDVIVRRGTASLEVRQGHCLETDSNSVNSGRLGGRQTLLWGHCSQGHHGPYTVLFLWGWYKRPSRWVVSHVNWGGRGGIWYHLDFLTFRWKALQREPARDKKWWSCTTDVELVFTGSYLIFLPAISPPRSLPKTMLNSSKKPISCWQNQLCISTIPCAVSTIYVGHRTWISSAQNCRLGYLWLFSLAQCMWPHFAEGYYDSWKLIHVVMALPSAIPPPKWLPSWSQRRL